jgi:MFS family permease
MLGDRFGRKRMLVAGLVLGALASTLTGLAGSVAALFTARLLTGLSQGFLFSNDRVIIAATTPKARMALGQGVSFSGPGVGTTLGLLLAGALGTMMPWRHVFLVFALPPLVAAVLVWRLIPEPERDHGLSDPRWPFRRVLRLRDFWLLGLAGTMPVYVQFSLATWAPLMFAEVGITDLGRSASLASLQGLVAPLGLLASGLVADRLYQRGVHRKLVMAATALCMTAAVAGLGWAIQRGGPAWLVTVLLLASSFFMWCSWAPAWAILGELCPPSVLGKAFGLYNATCFLGAIVGPFATGWLKDLTGSFAGGMYAAAALGWLCAVTAMALSPAFRLGRAPSVAAP